VSEFAAFNQRALKTLTEEYGVELRRFPDDVLATLRRLSLEAMNDLAASDPDLARVYASYRAYADSIGAWHEISEGAHTGIRHA
jgi:TRAP-type mannitol/chloroaromatic compound transport system substrate-binding protein